ncbi:hypothetical protein Back2_04060 [Nocardioides baekrokdamisoli]|uniref:Uncharacterized protein n=1 Tax=Nocardioides baekrokdamisoli TaxID=1804624 RepID=A0A3G9IZJ2_9ACTN|nr:hypothetical protein [Nocardioides baekrokdamisoli]BBH16119.1 hypothetical protein Back2_04060 [Nocardioides baekrokdamisoli]
MTKRTARHGDDGAMLLVALILITVIAIVTVALLNMGNGRFAATIGLRAVASTEYAADAAAKIAISDIELGTSAPGITAPSGVTLPWVYNNGIDGTGCFGGSGSLGSPESIVAKTSVNLSSFYSDPQSKTTKNATVTCSPVPGTGIFGLGSGAGGSTGGSGGSGGAGSGRALTILGSGGLGASSKNGAFSIRGDVMSAGAITSSKGYLYTTGTVKAPSCSTGGNAPKSAQGASGVDCAYAGTVDDPYAGVAPNSIPTDSSGNWVLGAQSGCSFTAGYYPDVTPLNACTNATFAPGTYYFDFHNNSTDPTYSSQYANSGDLWTVNGNVVGGQSTGSSSIPGSCVSPIDSTTAQGVQFIFGGDSQMTLGKDGNVELCGSYNNGKAPIVIYGLDGTSSARGLLAANYAASPTTSPNTAPSTVTPSGGFAVSPVGPTDAAAVANADSTVEKWTTASGGTANLSLSGFNIPGIPSGSTIKSVTLTLRHQESPTSGTLTPSLKFKVGSGANNSTTTQPTIKSSLTTETLDLTSDLASVVAAGNLGNTTLQFIETAKNGSTKGTSQVDQVQLQVAYWAPRLRGETATAIPNNCVRATGGSHCDLFGISASGGSFKGALVVNGTTYVPVGSVNGNISNGSGTVALRWGLVADSADLNGWPQYSFSYPLVSIPDSGPGLGSNFTAVDLKVYLCDSGTCPTTGTPALTARVSFTDPIDSTTDIVTPTAGARIVSVMSWAPAR